MVNQGKTTSDFPIKTTLFDNQDRVVIIYGASTANTSNTVAQTATIAVTNLFAANGSLNIPTLAVDPANSTSMTIGQGSIFATPNFFYVAIANNITRRVALSSF